MKSQSLEEKNTEVNRVSKVFFVTFRGGKTRGGERERGEEEIREIFVVRASLAGRWKNNREPPVAPEDKRDISPSDKFPR